MAAVTGPASFAHEPLIARPASSTSPSEHVLDVVRRLPGIDKVALNRMVPAGSGIARILVKSSKLELRGERFYLPGVADVPTRVVVPRSGPDVKEQLRTLIRADPDGRLSTGAIRRALAGRGLNAAHEMFEDGELARIGKRGAFSYQFAQQQAPKPTATPAPTSNVPDSFLGTMQPATRRQPTTPAPPTTIERGPAAPAPPIAAAATTSARSSTSTTSTTRSSSSTSTKKDSSQARVLALAEKSPKGITPAAATKKLPSVKHVSTVLSNLYGAGRLQRRGARGAWTYFATNGRKPTKRAAAAASTTRRTSRTTTSTSPQARGAADELEKALARIRTAEADVAAAQKELADAWSDFDATAARRRA